MRIRWLTRLRGRIQREVGEATGDRRVEAEGAVTAELGERPDEANVDRAAERIRAEHGDIRWRHLWRGSRSGSRGSR